MCVCVCVAGMLKVRGGGAGLKAALPLSWQAEHVVTGWHS